MSDNDIRYIGHAFFFFGGGGGAQNFRLKTIMSQLYLERAGISLQVNRTPPNLANIYLE